MSSHKDTLRLLIPVELEGVFEDDLEIEGALLDDISAAADVSALEMFPDTATELLPLWESVFQIVPSVGASLESRRAVVAQKLGGAGDIKKPYFVSLAAAAGYTIYIQDYTPAMSDWLCAGDELIDGEPWIDFSAGVDTAGETLSHEDAVLPWIWEVVVVVSADTKPSPTLEAMLNDLKPAHIQLNFTYL